MAGVAAGDIIRFVAKFAQYAQELQNVYHALVIGSQSSDSSVFASIAAWLETAYTELLPDFTEDLTFDSIVAYNVTQDALIGEDDWPTLVDGENVSEGLPLQVAHQVNFTTPFLRSQGRKYIPAFGESSVEDGGNLVASASANVGDFAAEVLENISGTSWTGVVGAYRYPNDLPARFGQYNTALVKEFPATQRRRKIGTGI